MAKLLDERGRKLRAIAEELADVWSWSVSIVAKYKQQMLSFEKYLESRREGEKIEQIRKSMKGSRHISLSESIWQEYGLKNGELRCHDCDARPCECAQQRVQPLDREAFKKIEKSQGQLLIRAFREPTI